MITGPRSYVAHAPPRTEVTARGLTVCEPCDAQLPELAEQVEARLRATRPATRYELLPLCRCRYEAGTAPALLLAWTDGPAYTQLDAALGDGQRPALRRNLSPPARVRVVRTGQLTGRRTPTESQTRDFALEGVGRWERAVAEIARAYDTLAWPPLDVLVARLASHSTAEVDEFAALAGTDPAITLDEVIRARALL